MSHIVVVDSDILIDMSRDVDMAIDCIERLEEKSTVTYSLYNRYGIDCWLW